MHAGEFIRHSNDSVILQSEASPDMQDTRGESIFGIHIANLGLLMSTASYCEVLDKIQVNALPNVQQWLSGIMNLRGNIVPVFDLHLMLEEVADNKKRRLMAIDRGDKAVALWIDGFPEIIDSKCLQPLKLLPVLPQIFQNTVTCGYTKEDQVWLDVKLEDLFKILGRQQYPAELVV
jgi:twitching motility protein PilI